MQSPTIFAQIRKVDEEKRLVFGRATEEKVDKAGEIMDYMSSKPHFQKWSADIAADTGGKNLGNLRAMHGKVAAGMVTAIDYNDGEKAIDVCAKVVDDNEWKKVLAGVYTGFSIGGSYVGEKKVEKMADGIEATRYTAKPSELSLVDRPCVTGAKFFDVQKADGSVAHVDFVGEPVAEDMEISGSAEDVAAFGKFLNSNGLTMADINKALPAWLKSKKKGADDSKDDDSKGDDADDDTEKMAKAAAAAAETDRLAKAAGEAADAAADESLIKLEASLTDALAKVGARNSKADADRLKKIHDMTIELGHQCGGADDDAEKLAKAAEADRLAKLAAEPSTLEKLLAEKLAPMQKLLDDAAAKIVKLEAQPEAPRVSLRVLTKAADTITDPTATPSKPALVKDAAGIEHEAASLIKSLHSGGGVSLTLPEKLRG